MGKSIAELERLLQQERNKNKGLTEMKELGNKRSQLIKAIRAERQKRTKLGRLVSGTKIFAKRASVAYKNYAAEQAKKAKRIPKRRVKQFDPFSIID